MVLSQFMTIMPNKTFSIGLVAVGGRGWIGGGLYIAHIFESLLVWRSAHPEFPLKIFIICSDLERLKKEFPVYLKADGFVTDFSPSFLAKLLSKGLAIFSKLLPSVCIPSVQFLGFGKNNLNFVYPFVGSFYPLAGPRFAAWIPDFQHRYLPEYFNSAEINARDVNFGRIAQNSTDIVFSSKDSLKSFSEFYPCSRARLHVLPFCSIPPASLWAQHPSGIRLSYNLPRKFLLCSGQFWIHKNQLLVLRAIHELKKEVEDLFVVFTGHTYDNRFPDYFDKFLTDSHLLGVRSNIAILGMIPRADQLQLMRNSVAVVQPSLFEGWSTVVEDARALGKKIILSDLAVHDEQRHPDSLFFVRSSVGSLATAMRDAWKNGMIGPEACCEDASRSETSRLVMNMGECFMSIALGSA
jgi:glycosyltransferase involved in cell wall biosynthesis